MMKIAKLCYLLYFHTIIEFSSIDNKDVSPLTTMYFDKLSSRVLDDLTKAMNKKIDERFTELRDDVDTLKVYVDELM